MRAQELEALADWLVAQQSGDAGHAASAKLKGSIDHHLAAARKAAEDEDSGRWDQWVSSLSGSSVQRALGNIDAVETDLLRMAKPDYLRGQMPSLLSQIHRFLPKDDPRRMRVTAIADRLDNPAAGRPFSRRRLETFERDAVVDAYHAASSQRLRASSG